jgi:hypothetical protein
MPISAKVDFRDEVAGRVGGDQPVLQRRADDAAGEEGDGVVGALAVAGEDERPFSNLRQKLRKRTQ